jgi:predicted dithiol-disulfide oxidoreductase (DUF899 family)
MHPPHRIVSRDEWLSARKALLAREKELTRARDELSRARRALPWVRIDKTYVFDGPAGRETLADLFGGNSQLIVQHFMFAPGWGEGCVGCSFGADHVDGARRHFEHHDVAFAAVSRAPIAEIEAYRARMGWGFKWVSSHDSDFNYDFNVSFTPEQLAAGPVTYNYTPTSQAMSDEPGFSVFLKDDTGAIFHTYSSYGRGNEEIIGAYMFLDLTPNGRNETINGNLTDWVRRHDAYMSDTPPR